MSQNPHSNDGRQPGDTGDTDLDREVAEALGDLSIEQLMDATADSADAGGGEGTSASQVDANQIDFEMKRGRISAVRGDDVFVDLTGTDSKLQGVVPLKQFERPPRAGSVMDFVVERVDEGEGLVHLSREGAVTKATWQQLQRGAVVEARVVATNKGGLELEMVGGIQAFMPASQIDLHHVGELEPFVGEKLRGMVQEIDRRSRTVVLSRRRHLEHERLVKRQKLLTELEEGQTREGTVTNVVQYGAFVDLGGLDGLVHISDMSYTHIQNASDAVAVGQAVTVRVLKVDKDAQKIRLGLKQVEPDPWEGIENRVHSGEQVTGRVVRTADFGAFVEIEPGVEGLLPISEISWRRINRPSDVVNESDVLRLVVLNVDGDKQRISLSLKQAQGDPWRDINEKFPRGSLVEATVVRTTEFGAFVELEAGVEGLVHISELADRRVNNVTDVVQVGHKDKFRILEISPDNHRIKLSLKAAAAGAHVPAEAGPTSTPPAKPGKPARPRGHDESLRGGLGSNGALGTGLGNLKL